MRLLVMSFLLNWYQLERDNGGGWRAAVEAAMREKVAEVATAQEAGVISSRLRAAELVLTVQAIARMWLTQPKELVAVTDSDNRDRRDTIRAAVEALIS
jgi:Tetracyclin repressor-like, C-terminal domain